MAYLASPFHPAVLKLIDRTIQKAHEKKRWVGLCGEMAGDPLAVPLLLGMGLDEFSMSPSAIPSVKELIRGLDASKCEQIAAEALAQPSIQAVKDFWKDIAPINLEFDKQSKTGLRPVYYSNPFEQIELFFQRRDPA